MHDLVAENRRLREKIEQLQEEKRQREETTRSIGACFPPEWRLSHSQRVVLAALLEQPNHLASRDVLLTALNKYDCTTRWVDALVRQLRIRLQGSGIKIITVHTVGYQLSTEGGALLKKLVNEQAARMDLAVKAYLKT